MKVIEFVQIGEKSNTKSSTAIHNLTNDLSSVQNEFKFQYYDIFIKYPESYNSKKGITTDELEIYFKDNIKERFKYQFPIAICDCKLEDDLFTLMAQDVGIISTYHWKHLNHAEIERRLTLTLIDMILNLYRDTPVHYDPIGCPSDYCSEGEMSISLAKCNFCNPCKSKLNKAVESGKITMQQKVAVLRILDFLAQRKYSFILMPFAKEFDNVYKKALKPTLESLDYICKRADEISESKEIINIIWEQINRANIIIADLTGKNPNVYYELGYAHALGKDTILITESIDDVPFDLRHRKCVKYNRTKIGLFNLSESLKKFIL